MKLEDKVAIVTGAGRGMGGAIARRFAREGAHVTVAEIDEVSAHETFEAINRRGILVMTDMSSVAEINALVDKLATAERKVEQYQIAIGQHIANHRSVRETENVIEVLLRVLGITTRVRSSQGRDGAS